MTMGQLHAGAARIRLEPPIGLSMIGYGGRVGRASGVHDELAAQALVLGDGARKVALCGVDLLAIGIRVADEIRARVAAQSDLDADAILIGATHTHSAPIFNIFATPRPGAKLGDDRNLEWECALPGRIAGAILEANRRMEPAAIKTAGARFTLGSNRRLRRPDGSIQLAANYAGVADADANAMGVYRSVGGALAFLLNYPCHGVVLCEDNLLYSRDWPGYALDEIERLAAAGDRGARPIGIFLQGATGNIDPRSRGSFAVAEENGRALGRAAFQALAAAPQVSDAAIAWRRMPINLPLKSIDADLAIARECLAQTEASLHNHRGGDGYQLKRLRDHHEQSAQALRALEEFAEANRRDKRVDPERGVLASALSVAAIGDFAIVGLPGEAFVEYGLALKANPYFARTFVACYCNDLIGYIPTREAYPQGGYEVATARVAPGAGEAIMAAALAALRELGGTAGESAPRVP
jgi:Neutral/alkaline non-lysosomal ceramidase, N-terminal